MNFEISFETHKNLLKNLESEIKKVLTVSDGNRSLEVESVDIPTLDTTENLAAEKAAKVQGVSYTEPLRATLVLKEDGKVINRGKVKIMDLPRITSRGSYIVSAENIRSPCRSA